MSFVMELSCTTATASDHPEDAPAVDFLCDNGCVCICVFMYKQLLSYNTKVFQYHFLWGIPLIDVTFYKTAVSQKYELLI